LAARDRSQRHLLVGAAVLRLLRAEPIFNTRNVFPGGDGRKILQSIHDKLMPLPDDDVVIPGHGEITTIGREKRFNYFLQGL
jgi:glyoxylase-like metal-dependent hydrolase (beta-lactamase superfamily II)